MPSKSKAQQRFFGMVDAYKKGEMKNPSSKIKKAAKGMSMSDVKDFAETKHKGLPEKVEENMNKRVIRMTESDLHRIVKESVARILYENKEDYNEIIRNANRPKLNKKFKKAWDKEKETNPNADYDSFEYRFGCNHMPKGGVK